MIYILSQTRGNTATHLTSCLREDTPNLYLTIEDMLKYLKTVYLNLNQKNKIKAQFHELMQCTDNLF